MTHRSFFLLISLLGFLLSTVPTVDGQSEPRFRKTEMPWFIARVVYTNPFTIEYLDDWYQYQDETRQKTYDFGTDVSPHGVGEHVERFKLGDIIRGDFCYRFVGEDCPERAVPIVYVDSPNAGMRIEPPVAINLKKLDGRYKRKFSQKGILVDYRPREYGLIERVRIYRDGRITLRSSYGGTGGKLQRSELRALERDFFAADINSPQGIQPDVHDPSLTTIFGRLRSLKLDLDSNVGRWFTNQIDRLTERLLANAQYQITYRWRFKVKDWEYGDVLAIDEAAKPGYEFITKNLERLSAIKVPQEFYEEAKYQYGEIDKFMYSFKGKLYRFQLTTCTSPIGSWACYFANETGKGNSKGEVIGPYDQWPASLAVSLRDIPDDALTPPQSYRGKGVPIPKDDFMRNRKFYSQLLMTHGQFREGDVVYWGITVWFQ